jgi:hypothetical protein
MVDVFSLRLLVVHAENTSRKTQTAACVTLPLRELDLLLENAILYLGMLRQN